MCENFTLSVKPHADSAIYKDRIISALYLHPAIDNHIKGICYRNFIKPETRIWEDVKGETFYHLCRKSPEDIISMYEDNPARLLGLIIRIAILKGVASNSNNPDYPKHSIAKYILFASNLSKHEYLSPIGEKDVGDFVQTVLHPDTLPDNFKEMWDTILSELTPEENTFLEEHFNMKRRQGSITKAYKAKYNSLLDRVEDIITKYRYIINTTEL